MKNFPGYVTWSKNMRPLKICQEKYSNMCVPILKEAFNQKTPYFCFKKNKLFFNIYTVSEIVLFP